MDLYETFERFVQERALVERGTKILLAVSGGADSVVMTDLFFRMRDKWQFSLAIGHVNHGLRGRRADEDERSVRKLAQKYGLVFYSVKTNVGLYAKNHRLSLEEGGREIRFLFLMNLLNRIGYSRLALGHQANDRAETILMNLTRGSGIRGMVGIRPRRDSIIHPILFAKRDQIESYARHKRLRYAVDVTNRDKRFYRNRIRWDIMAKLEQVTGPHVVTALCRCGDAALEADQFLNSHSKELRRAMTLDQSESQIILDLYKFLTYLKAVQKVIFIDIVEEMTSKRGCVRASEIQRMIQLASQSRSGSSITLHSGVTLTKSQSTLAFSKHTVSHDETVFPIGSNVLLKNGVLLKSRLLKNKKDLAFTSDPSVEYFHYDALIQPLSLRSVRPGDWFVPLGMNSRKKLHDFFIDENVPVFQRSSVPLLVSGKDIVWVVGHRLDDRFKVRPETERILKVEISVKKSGRRVRTSPETG